MYSDDSKVIGGLGASGIFISLKGEKLDYVLQIHFAASNNVAEHKAFLHGLWIVVSLDIMCELTVLRLKAIVG